MRLLLLCGLLAVTTAPASAQEKLLGAWETSFLTANGESATLSLIFADGFFSMTSYQDTTFLATLGGSYRADWETFSITYEWDSSDPENVGSVATMPYRIAGNALIFNNDKVWTRVDEGKEGELAGAWVIVGRKRNGEMRRNFQTGPRKTMKILSGKRFQWIAFNTETQEMLGTGGGAYTSEDGLYIEKIEFFSRDNSRVGAQLSFDFKIRNGEWHHSGNSSKGKPIYEVWGKR